MNKIKDQRKELFIEGVTEREEDILADIAEAVDEIIMSDYNSMSAEGQEQIDKLAFMTGQPPGCYVMNSNDKETKWNAKYKRVSTR